MLFKSRYILVSTRYILVSTRYILVSTRYILVITVTDMGSWSITQRRWYLIRFNQLIGSQSPGECLLTIQINVTFIHVESTSCLLAPKPSYYTIILQYTIFNVRPGNNRLPRSGTLARGNTYFLRIYFPRTSGLAQGKHPHSAHLYLARGP